MTIVQLVALTFALAFLSESLVEYLFGVAIDHAPKLAPARWALQYIAVLAGVGLAFYYHLDLLAPIGGVDASPVGFILTGCIIGRGANYLHQFVSAYFPKAVN